MKYFILSLLFIFQSILVYSQDNNPPTLNSFSFSPTTAQLSDNIKVSFSLSASDAQNKVEKIIVEFSPEKGGGNYSETFSKIDLASVNLTGDIDFGKNPKTGLYLVSIYLEDDKKNKVTLSSSDLSGMGFNSTFEITENTTVDITPPALNGFSFSPNQIDLSSNDHSIQYQLNISDDISGLEEATIEFSSPGKGNGKSETIRKLTGLTASLNESIDFGKNPDVGIWSASITLKDKAGNQVSYSSLDLNSKNFSSSLEIKETKDITPPQLTGFSFSPNEIDLASEQTVVSFNVSATDDISGVEEVTVEFSPPGNGGSKSETFRKISNKSVNLSGTIDLGKNPSIGTWTAKVSLKDGAGNVVTYSSSDLTGKNFPSSLEIKDTKDITPPVLNGFMISPSKLDLNSANQSVEYRISASDNLSGIDEIKISFIPEKSGGSKVERISKINKNEFEIIGWVDFKNSKEGFWSIEVELTDNKKNTSVYKKDELGLNGFSSTLEVINTLDVQKPFLEKFDFIIETKNENDKVLIINYSITVSDDLSGIDEVKIMFEPVNNGGGVFAKFNNIRSSKFDYSGKLELKNPKEGDWITSIYLTDMAKNQITLTKTDLENLGFASGFSVATSKQLSLLSPASGDIIEIPNKIDIAWDSKGVNKIDIALSTDNGNTWTKIAGNLNAITKRHNWTPNLNTSCNALLKISDVDDNTIFDEHSFQFIQKSTTSVNEENELISEDLLLQNYPNPFNPSTNIPFKLKNAGRVVIAVYSMLGEKIIELVNDYKTPGYYSINFNAHSLPSGYYFYRLITDNKVQTRKMLLLK
ncbi:MAG: T9SS type A sorting domain-containing protein [Ignavibacteria bacterium]|nr:T9SS type A sorting domain-containing protein [Ignavibacteria bacterium]